MHFSANTWTDEKNQTASRYNSTVLKGIFLFLSAVILLLFLSVDRTGNLPLRSVVKQNGKRFFSTGQTSRYLRKFLLTVGRHYSRIMQALLKNTVQNMNKAVTVFPIHVKSGCMIFPERIVFQVNRQEIKTEFPVTFFLFGNWKWHKNTGLVYPDSSFAAQRNQSGVKKRKSIFHDSSACQDTFDKSFGYKLGGNRRQAVLQKVGEK